jgi:cysteine-rich repeat protein
MPLRLFVILMLGCSPSLPQLPQGAVGVDLCGNGATDPGEACDDGNKVETDVCLSDCSLNVCLDGNVLINAEGAENAAVEQCDDGNPIDQDACRNDCTWARCGDGVMRTDIGPGLNGSEECDDGNASNEDGCTNQCTIAVCGDGFVQDGETCDDRNADGGDGCDAGCQLECGNGSVEGDETCDDGNDDDNDLCPRTCRFAACGDGHRRLDLAAGHQDAEACDDGNDFDADGCVECKMARCGDGIARQDVPVGEQGYESCDDANDDSGDACVAGCATARCGDGFVRQVGLEEGAEGYEVCDDGNEDQADACRHCQLERCGDGVIDRGRGESCDSLPGQGDGTCNPVTCQPLITEVVMGSHFGCVARADGSVLCWPPNQLHPDPPHDPLADLADGPPVGATRMVRVDPPANLHHLCSGGSAVCAISRSHGRVYCWGDNSESRLGRSVAPGVSNDAVARPVFDNVARPVRALGCQPMAGRFCVLDEGGAVFCWGGGNWEVWDPMTGLVPERFLGEDNGFKQIAVGYDSFCVIDTDDRVGCFGSNHWGGLGDNGQVGDFSASIVIVPGLPVGVIEEIAAGPLHYCARPADRSVYCWGSNEMRAVGFFDDMVQRTPYRHPHVDQVTALALNYELSCALRLGALRCWGDPTIVGIDEWPALPLAIGGMPEGVVIQSVVTGPTAACALAATNRVYCWGFPVGTGSLPRFGVADQPYPTAVEVNPWDSN